MSLIKYKCTSRLIIPKGGNGDVLAMEEDEDLNLAIALSLSETSDTQGSRRSAQSKVGQGLPRDRDAKAEKDDESYALMLQISEQEEVEKAKMAVSREDCKDDGKLAKRLQAQFEKELDEGRSRNDQGGFINSMMNRFRGRLDDGGDSSMSKCFSCGRVPFDGRMVTTGGRAYCPSCMRCKICSQILNGQVYHHQNDQHGLYCFACLQEKHGLRCSVCRSFLHGQYLRHNFFESEKYCLTHEQIENRRKCTSCHRIEPMSDTSGRGPFVDLPDERPVCLECLDSAVMTTDEVAALYVSVVDFMESSLGLAIPFGMRQVPVLAVDTASLNNEMNRGALTHSGPGSQQVQVRGLTLSRSGELKHYTAGDLSFSWQHGWRMGPGRVHRVDTVREVTAVLVLYGLPRDLTASILAHEATHVYLKLSKDIPLDLSLPAEEGLCQVVAHRFLNNLHERAAADQARSNSGVGGGGAVPRERVRTGGFDFHRSPLSSSSSSLFASRGASWSSSSSVSDSEDPTVPLEDKLRKYFIYSIEHDPSPVYGDGFRHAKRVVDTLGLEIAVEELKFRKTLPELGSK